MVCLSGGKDSYGCSMSSSSLRCRAAVLELIAVNLDSATRLSSMFSRNYLASLGIPSHRVQTVFVVKPSSEGETM